MIIIELLTFIQFIISVILVNWYLYKFVIENNMKYIVTMYLILSLMYYHQSRDTCTYVWPVMHIDTLTCIVMHYQYVCTCSYMFLCVVTCTVMRYWHLTTFNCMYLHASNPLPYM